MQRGGDVVGVVVGAGRSQRFGGDLPKQFLELAGKPVIHRSVEALSSCPGIAGVVVVLPSADATGPRGETLRRLPGVRTVVAGGATRACSALNGARAAGEAEFVLVHDAARPLASPALVSRVVEATLRHGAAVPGIAVADTTKEVDCHGRVVGTLDRGSLRLAQTPQGARTRWLIEALEQAAGAGEEIGDEATALERAGRSVWVVAGEAGNLKITGPADLERARRMLATDGGQMRIGTGFDVHRFGAGRTLVLGGVTFPDHPGLVGHSDADVVLHAVMDALLGAAALGDIGLHFPPDDPKYAGAASTALAAEVGRMVAEAGYAVVNIDATVLAEGPKIGPRSDEMRASIASSLALAPERVGLKATTLEGLGALGRGEGIACQAVALIEARSR
jgi:2-C-methyl-D-erythritol 4-phosphate cytidylyltransferase/2-C-methyl-D-erythritol 2,4-cyclodiphosphate synthase